MRIEVGRMDEQDILDLSDEEIEKIERVNQSFAEREQAEAAKERHQKLRVLFERASRDALPGIAYMVYVGYLALAVLFRLMEYSGEKLYIGSFLLFVIVVAPLILLPSNLWNSLKRKILPRSDDE